MPLLRVGKLYDIVVVNVNYFVSNLSTMTNVLNDYLMTDKRFDELPYIS